MAPTGGIPGLKEARAGGLDRVRVARLREHFYWISGALLLAVMIGFLVSIRISAGSWIMFSKRWKHFPSEVLFLLPIVSLFIFAAYRSHAAIGPSVLLLCVGGVAVTWLNGLALTAAPTVSAKRVGIHVLANIVGVVSLAYITLHRNGLIDLLVQTIRFGPDTG